MRISSVRGRARLGRILTLATLGSFLLALPTPGVAGGSQAPRPNADPSSPAFLSKARR